MVFNHPRVRPLGLPIMDEGPMYGRFPITDGSLVQPGQKVFSFKDLDQTPTMRDHHPVNHTRENQRDVELHPNSIPTTGNTRPQMMPESRHLPPREFRRHEYYLLPRG